METDRKKKSSRKRIRYVNLPCHKCHFVGISQAKLDVHIRHAHKEEKLYECNICDFNTQWNREYYTHMRTHFQGPPFECDYEDCDYSSERIQFLLYHRMVHTDQRPFSCSVCNLRFRTKNNVYTHMRCHTGEKPFQCVVCDKSFATKGTLEQHTVTHSDTRPYLCDTCGFSTKYQSHLNAHKRIHTGDVFKCQYLNCTYSTPKRSQLGCHMRTHMSIRSHMCATCGRAFGEKRSLVRHERIHQDDRPFKCNLCEYSSTRRDIFKEHMSKHHGEKPWAKTPYKPRRSRRATTGEGFPNVELEQSDQQFLVSAAGCQEVTNNNQQPPVISDNANCMPVATQNNAVPLNDVTLGVRIKSL